MENTGLEKHKKLTIFYGLCYTILAISLSGCGFDNSPSSEFTSMQTFNGVTYLGQGWDMRERQELLRTSFGSRVLPYSWFIALEQVDNDQLFRDNSHMSALGFIVGEKDSFNPDALPVGITSDQDDQGNSWMGLTCAACHTGQVTINNQPIRIDGGQSLINYTQFEVELLSALQVTVAQPEKWQRFFARLHQLQENISEESEKQKIQQRIQELKVRYAMNATDVPYGAGRLDAFGQIFNAIAVDALHIPENRRSPDAPTSFPVLWDASHLDVVQWNASAPNTEPGPLAQNATTALAVYGTVDVLGHAKTYPSSIAIKNLGYLQRRFYKLTAPHWPQSLAGELDKNLMMQGEKIYQRECIQCHQLVDEKNPNRQLRAVVVPAADVGTDTRMVDNFSQGKVKTGELEGKNFAVWFGKKIGSESSRLDVVMHVTVGALAQHPLDSLHAITTEFAKNASPSMNDSILYYKARPINGIWSSAPYLHNGSVPTIYDLLLPVAQRPKDFWVGNRELDRAHVGNQISYVTGATRFNTELLGNSNSGHLYGTALTESERLALLEFIKNL